MTLTEGRPGLPDPYRPFDPFTPAGTYQPPPSGPATTDEAARSGRQRGPLLVLGALLIAVSGGLTGALVQDQLSGGSTSSGAAARSTSTSTVDPRVLAAAAPSGSVEAAAAIISGSVVTIEVTGDQSVATPFGDQQTRRVSDTGSGVVLRPDGYILTNNHVVEAASQGGSVSVTFSDGTTVAATITGTDPTSDLAVLKVARGGLKAASFADSATLKVGQAVIAVGAPLGLSNTVTLGIVSTLNRPVATGENNATAQSVIDAVQTDAAINPGNSGGALADLGGRVVGINSAIATSGAASTGNIGVGFAIPANTAVKVADQLIRDGHATHAQIGISVADATATVVGAPGIGATVNAVAPGGPAAAAGLRPGDVITKVGERLVTDSDSLIVSVRSHDPGSKLPLTYIREGRTTTTSVTLGTAG
jgi:putative serine protease PepD